MKAIEIATNIYLNSKAFKDDVDSIKGSFPNQEKLIIKKDLFANLSEEAKLVITTIINAPDEIIVTFNRPFKVKKFIGKMFGYRSGYSKKVEKIINEINAFVKNF